VLEKFLYVHFLQCQIAHVLQFKLALPLSFFFLTLLVDCQCGLKSYAGGFFSQTLSYKLRFACFALFLNLTGCFSRKPLAFELGLAS
jgi:hypothetical protein